MKVLFFIFLVVSMQFGQAQKVVEKTIFDTDDTAIEIDASNCYAVFVTTSKSNKVIVAAKMAGEYSDNLSLNIHEEGNTLLVDTGFNLNFDAPNDKLSAHKVVSISLHISVPEHLRVRIFGTYSNVDISGFYKNLDVSLNDGNCTLRNTGVDTSVQTQSGTITVVADSGTITAKTKYGRLSSEEIKSGNDVYNLKSVTGNIHLKKLN